MTKSPNQTTLLVKEIKACRLCEAHLPQGPRPVLQIHTEAKILVAGQAPGNKVHQSGVPFDDASGERLRTWMGIDKTVFYDATKIAILPMGFCYPGTGKSGDLPPRPECAAAWREKCLAQMPKLELILVIGQYAQVWHLGEKSQAKLTDNVNAWRTFWPDMLPLPHPSPRNNIWLKQNAWFADDVLPILQERIGAILRIS